MTGANDSASAPRQSEYLAPAVTLQDRFPSRQLEEMHLAEVKGNLDLLVDVAAILGPDAGNKGTSVARQVKARVGTQGLDQFYHSFENALRLGHG